MADALVVRKLTIISGGQTGADQGGIDVALATDHNIDGWAPHGYRTANGTELWLRKYLREHPSAQYAPRTIANVRMSDALLWIGNPHSPGGHVTLAETKRRGLPFFELPYPWDGLRTQVALDVLPTWLKYPDGTYRVKNLMIAGNGEQRNPGIREYVRTVLVPLLQRR